MFERFTDRIRKVMALANDEAKRFNHEYVGTEHILLGLVREGSGQGANVLNGLNIDLEKIRLEVEKLVKSGPNMVTTLGRLPHTPRAQKVIESAIESARKFNREDVGTENLLYGLVEERDGVAANVLMNLGLYLEDVETQIEVLYDGSRDQVPQETERDGYCCSIKRFRKNSGDIPRLWSFCYKRIKAL